MINQLIIILPEILLVMLAVLFQTIAVFMQKISKNFVYLVVFLASFIIFYLLFIVPESEIIFLHSYKSSYINSLFKSIVLAFSLVSIVLYSCFCHLNNTAIKMEFITLILLSVLGLFIAISAEDLLLLFCGLELQALSGYALAAFNTKSLKSSEAGLKYFILGALMTSIMLLGISFLYGFGTGIRYIDIFYDMSHVGMIVGSILVLANVLFKLSAAPLHIWAPDVYEGAPIFSVSYFSTAGKIGVFIVLINLLRNALGEFIFSTINIIKILAIISMLIGSFGAIMQNSLKRLMAYSSVLNIGYVLIAISLNSSIGDYVAFLYLFIYIISVICFLICLVSLLGEKSDSATFEDLAGFSNHKKALSAIISLTMFSMIGLPPFAGFFGKYYVFYNAILEGEILLAVIGMLTSIVAAFYYLKVIKYIYFVDSKKEIKYIPTQFSLGIITFICTVFIVCFALFADNYIIIV